MPRSARLLIDGGTYHVLARGNNGQKIFHQDVDYRQYLQLLLRYARPHHLKVYHFVLMPNHVHLLLEAPIAIGLSKAMHGLNLTYALFYRKRYQYRGHLWQGRFRSLLIDRSGSLLECGQYLELNPVQAGLVKDPQTHAWSSYRTYAEGAENPVLTPNPLYATLGASAQERQERYRQFAREMLEQQRPLASFHPHRFSAGGPDSITHLEERFGFPRLKRRRGRPNKLLLNRPSHNNASSSDGT